jgi:hypothetical protein
MSGMFEGKFQEDLLLCNSIEAYTTGEDIFPILDEVYCKPPNWLKQMYQCSYCPYEASDRKNLYVMASMKTASKV